MSATDELRKMLDERGVEWKEHRHVMPGSMAIQRETLWGQPTDVASGKPIPHVYHYRATEMSDGRLFLEAQLIAPAQAIAATVGSGTCRKVYLVETSDDLFEGWYPMAAYLHRESAEDCAEALRKKDGGIWQFARVSELKVVDE